MRCRNASAAPKRRAASWWLPALLARVAEALQRGRNAQVRLDVGGARKCVVGVAFGLFWLTLR